MLPLRRFYKVPGEYRTSQKHLRQILLFLALLVKSNFAAIRTGYDESHVLFFLANLLGLDICG